MTSTRVLVVALVLAAGLARAERSSTEWVSFDTAAGVRAGDGSSVFVAFLPRNQCRPRVSVARGAPMPAQPEMVHGDTVDSWVTLRIDGQMPWRTDRPSIYEADGVMRAAIDDLHPDLIAELSAGDRLDLGHTTAPLTGAGQALKAARHACQMVLEASPLLPRDGAARMALSH
jgi:hypothetical protein